MDMGTDAVEQEIYDLLLETNEECVKLCRPGTCIREIHNLDWLELPAALILIIVVAPSLFADTIRGHWVGLIILLIIGIYLLQDHIRASGGFRNSFTRSNGISNSNSTK